VDVHKCYKLVDRHPIISKSETSMTNLKSVDNYGFMTAKPFVMNNRTYCLIDGIQFVIYTTAPDLLPFSQTVVRDTNHTPTPFSLPVSQASEHADNNCHTTFLSLLLNLVRVFTTYCHLHVTLNYSHD